MAGWRCGGYLLPAGGAGLQAWPRGGYELWWNSSWATPPPSASPLSVRPSVLHVSSACHIRPSVNQSVRHFRSFSIPVHNLPSILPPAPPLRTTKRPPHSANKEKWLSVPRFVYVLIDVFVSSTCLFFVACLLFIDWHEIISKWYQSYAKQNPSTLSDRSSTMEHVVQRKA